jgi:alkylated DNA repair protein (DNA oxidative demethylase)
LNVLQRETRKKEGRSMPLPQRGLFDTADADAPSPSHPAEGLVCLRGLADTAALRAEVAALCELSPFRHMSTPNGGSMSVAMTNCGLLGWTSDARGYRYTNIDPLTSRPWPAMPPSFRALARQAAARGGFEGFEPDACLVNRYAPGASLGLHRDSDERDFAHPIVSVSIGASAQFLWGGLRRQGPVRRVEVHDGDVLVWGGPVRLVYHGVAPLRTASADAQRLNLTFRRAG